MKKYLFILFVSLFFIFSCSNEKNLIDTETNFSRFVTAIETQDINTVEKIISFYPTIFIDNKDLNINMLERLLETENYSYIKTAFKTFPENFWYTKSSDGDVPLSFLLRKNSPYEIIRCATDYYIDLNFRDAEGETLLTIAASNSEDLDVIHLLIDKGCSIQEINIREESPLICAARYNSNPFIYKELKRFYLEVSVPINSSEVILAAACNKEFGVFKNIFYWEKSVDLNKKDDYGKSALIYASEYSNLQTVKFLLENNVEVNTQDLVGKTALMYACETNNNHNIIKILKKNKASSKIQDDNGFTEKYYRKHNENFRKSNIIFLILISIVLLLGLLIMLVLLFKKASSPYKYICDDCGRKFVRHTNSKGCGGDGRKKHNLRRY